VVSESLTEQGLHELLFQNKFLAVFVLAVGKEFWTILFMRFLGLIERIDHLEAPMPPPRPQLEPRRERRKKSRDAALAARQKPQPAQTAQAG
jgi:hypothetical protein